MNATTICTETLHSGREDILSHSGSALCMKRLENPSSGTFDKDLQVNPFLQAQGRYKAYFHPEIIC